MEKGIYGNRDQKGKFKYILREAVTNKTQKRAPPLPE